MEHNPTIKSICDKYVWIDGRIYEKTNTFYDTLGLYNYILKCNDRRNECSTIFETLSTNSFLINLSEIDVWSYLYTYLSGQVSQKEMPQGFKFLRFNKNSNSSILLEWITIGDNDELFFAIDEAANIIISFNPVVTNASTYLGTVDYLDYKGVLPRKSLVLANKLTVSQQLQLNTYLTSGKTVNDHQGLVYFSNSFYWNVIYTD